MRIHPMSCPYPEGCNCGIGMDSPPTPPVPCSLPRVAGRMECSGAEFERRCLVLIEQEQGKALPDNGLIAVLCDGVRLAREYSQAMNS